MAPQLLASHLSATGSEELKQLVRCQQTARSLCQSLSMQIGRLVRGGETHRKYGEIRCN
jgi:hypothetical protein